MTRLAAGPAPWIAFVVVAAGLAGCYGTDPPTSTDQTVPPPSPPPPPPFVPTFDGEAALDFVKGFALKEDGTPRYRMPGTVGQTEGAAYLWAQMELAGWTRQWQNLTGQDYLDIPDRPTAGYERGPACSESDRARLPGLPFHNLVAVRSGRARDAPLLLLGAHWDSLFGSYQDDPSAPYPGANDGASGVGLLLQLMRELDGMDLPFGVAIVFLDGEDGFNDCYPLVGSTYFASHPPFAVERFLLLDMVGSAEARFVRESQSEASDPRFVELLWRHGRALEGNGTSLHFTDTRTHITDDHTAFIAYGIPGVDVIDAGRPTTFPPEWHTTRDTVDRLSPGMLALVGDTILAAMQDPAFHASWPE